MNGKVTNGESAEAHLTKKEKVEPCIKGREALAPRDLAAYSRLITGTDLEEAGELPPHVPNTIEAEALGAKVLELCKHLQEKETHISEKAARDIAHLTSPAMLADVVANTFIADPYRRQNILEFCAAEPESVAWARWRLRTGQPIPESAARSSEHPAPSAA